MTSGQSQNHLQGLEELLQKLNELPSRRPDKMNAARQLISDENYPPDRLLNEIADLLATNLNQPSPD